VLGAYYFEEEGDVVNDITFFGLFGRATDVNLYGLDNESIALYGQADWNLASIPQLTLSFGLRYTEEDREQYVVRPDTAEGGAGAYSGVDSDTWNNTSGAFVAAWDHNDDVNFYFRVAQGWKSGGFNGEAPTEDAFREGYDEETVLSYELGMKSRFADDRIQLNVALFQNNVDDKQVSVFLEGSGGAASNVANAGEQTAEGVEVEYIWQVADPLRFSFTYGYLDTEYDEFIQSGVDIKDQRDVAFSPKNSYSAAIDWTLFEASWGNLDFHLDYSYNDDYDPYIRPDQNATTSVDDYEVMNASLMLSEVRVGDSATMMFNLWGKNILDEEYTQHGIPFGFWTATYFGNPATYGIDVRLEF
jgi:iron complex outermembrane receptor protein